MLSFSVSDSKKHLLAILMLLICAGASCRPEPSNYRDGLFLKHDFPPPPDIRLSSNGPLLRSSYAESFEYAIDQDKTSFKNTQIKAVDEYNKTLTLTAHGITESDCSLLAQTTPVKNAHIAGFNKFVCQDFDNHRQKFVSAIEAGNL